MKFDLSGKVAVITGAARGIGKAIALSMAKCGADLAILDMNVEGAGQTAEEAGKMGVKAQVYKADVSDLKQIQEIFREIRNTFGKIDILVNNAGIVSPKPFLETNEKEWDMIMGVNLKGVYNTCFSVLPFMIEQKYGKIVNIASIAGKTGGGFFGNTIYGTSKAGVIGLTKGIAREAGPFGINVNAICPGPIETQMLADCPEETRQRILSGVPLRKFGHPQDIANVAVFLSSDLASHMTGEITDVDGGIMRDN
ncbi:MAG: 3-oxoacyl-ACP reductase FabG [Synergistales bacterium]|nr:3-oxoacyl-ACP reductase FabG [Synergistales bacterium]